MTGCCRQWRAEFILVFVPPMSPPSEPVWWRRFLPACCRSGWSANSSASNAIRLRCGVDWNADAARDRARAGQAVQIAPRIWIVAPCGAATSIFLMFVCRWTPRYGWPMARDRSRDLLVATAPGTAGRQRRIGQDGLPDHLNHERFGASMLFGAGRHREMGVGVMRYRRSGSWRPRSAVLACMVAGVTFIPRPAERSASAGPFRRRNPNTG